MRRHVTFELGSPILLPEHGPAVPDSWLSWVHMALHRPDYQTIRPQAVDWISNGDLPLALDPLTGVWAVSAVQFPDPGVWVPNTGYRNEANSGDLTHRAEAFSQPLGNDKKQSLYTSKEIGSGTFHAIVYDLSGWYTPRLTFDVACAPEQEATLERYLTILAILGVGRKVADGYGVVRRWSWEDTDGDPVWEPNGAPRRPVPLATLSTPDPQGARYLYALSGTRWLGTPTLCAGPSPDSWHPKPWVEPPAEEEDKAVPSDDLSMHTKGA